MKKLLLLTLAACLSFSMAMAQNSANFHLWYGNVDGSAVSVGLDKDIEIQCWGATDPTPGNPDSVTFLHNPLASADLYITARNGGFFPPPPGLGGWDDRSFLAVNANNPAAGFTNQSVLGFAYLSDPRDAQNFIYTLGAPVLLCTYRMHTGNDPLWIGTYVDAFVEGDEPNNGATLWGMQDGVRGVNPTKHFSQLYFSPNAAPEWGANPGPITAPPASTICFNLSGTDVDLENILNITGPAGLVIDEVGPGFINAHWCGAVPEGPSSLSFFLTDGTEVVELVVELNGVCGDLANSELYIGCVDAFPGANIWLPVNIDAPCYVGGYELLIGWDATALHYTGFQSSERFNWGLEYFNVVPDAAGPGTARFVWIADINNGIPTPPAAGGDGPLGWILFTVETSLPWGMHIPVEFIGSHYTDNTISDETGYEFIHPNTVDGCVNTVNPDNFKGDPNMNCFVYEIADAVLVAQRLIQGYVVWAADDFFPNTVDCDRHFDGNDPLQEAAADLNNNTYADVADLVRFINIINGYIMPPKLDPATGNAVISVSNGAVMINSGVEVGGVLVKVQHAGEVTAPVAANGMDVLYQDANGVLSVLVYSLAGTRIPAGEQILFSVAGESMTIVETQVSDSYGRLLNSSAFVDAPLPTTFAVAQNYPNPFNAKTLISFALPTASDVTINIYSITGQLVETINGHYEAGYQSVNWDASAVASGVYFAKVSAGDNNQTLKMTLLK